MEVTHHSESTVARQAGSSLITDGVSDDFARSYHFGENGLDGYVSGIRPRERGADRGITRVRPTRILRARASGREAFLMGFWASRRISLRNEGRDMGIGMSKRRIRAIALVTVAGMVFLGGQVARGSGR